MVFFLLGIAQLEPRAVCKSSVMAMDPYKAHPERATVQVV